MACTPPDLGRARSGFPVTACSGRLTRTSAVVSIAVSSCSPTNCPASPMPEAREPTTPAGRSRQTLPSSGRLRSASGPRGSKVSAQPFARSRIAPEIASSPTASLSASSTDKPPRTAPESLFPAAVAPRMMSFGAVAPLASETAMRMLAGICVSAAMRLISSERVGPCASGCCASISLCLAISASRLASMARRKGEGRVIENGESTGISGA